MLQIRVHAEHDGGGRNGRGRLYLYYVDGSNPVAARQKVIGILLRQDLKEGIDFRVGDAEYVDHAVVDAGPTAASRRCPCGEMDSNDCAGECGEPERRRERRHLVDYVVEANERDRRIIEHRSRRS